MVKKNLGGLVSYLGQTAVWREKKKKKIRGLPGWPGRSVAQAAEEVWAARSRWI